MQDEDATPPANKVSAASRESSRQLSDSAFPKLRNEAAALREELNALMRKQHVGRLGLHSVSNPRLTYASTHEEQADALRESIRNAPEIQGWGDTAYDKLEDILMRWEDLSARHADEIQRSKDRGRARLEDFLMYGEDPSARPR